MGTRPPKAQYKLIDPQQDLTIFYKMWMVNKYVGDKQFRQFSDWLVEAHTELFTEVFTEVFYD